MYVTTKKSDTERSLAVELILEDIPGGCAIEKDDIPTSSSGIKEGTLVGKGSDGIYHIVKTAMVVNAAATNANALVVYANHEFIVGDFIGTSSSGVASGALITAIAASGAGVGIITCTWAGPDIAASGILVQASGLGHSNFKYVPVGISTNYVERDKENTGCGIVVRGRVRQNLMPYVIDDLLKTKLPLIRFV
jgi:hypothetical protein